MPIFLSTHLNHENHFSASVPSGIRPQSIVFWHIIRGWQFKRMNEWFFYLHEFDTGVSRTKYVLEEVEDMYNFKIFSNPTLFQPHTFPPPHFSTNQSFFLEPIVVLDLDWVLRSHPTKCLEGWVGVNQQLLEISLEPSTGLWGRLEGISETAVEIVSDSGGIGSSLRSRS